MASVMANIFRGNETNVQLIEIQGVSSIHDKPKPFPGSNGYLSIDSCISMSSEEGDTTDEQNSLTMDWSNFYYQISRSEMASNDCLGSYCTPFNLKHLSECRCQNCLLILMATTDPYHLPISPLTFDKQRSIFDLSTTIDNILDTVNSTSNGDSYSRRRRSSSSSTLLDYNLVTSEANYECDASTLVMPHRPPRLQRQPSVFKQNEELMKSINKSIPPFRLTKPIDAALYREPCCETPPSPTPQSVLSILPFNTGIGGMYESLAFTFGAQCTETITGNVAFDGNPEYALEDLDLTDNTCYSVMSSIFTTRYTTEAVQHKPSCIRSMTNSFVIDLIRKGNLPPVQEEGEESATITCVSITGCSLYCTCCVQESDSGSDNGRSKLLLDSPVSYNPRGDDVTYLSVLCHQYELDLRMSLHQCSSMGIRTSEQVIGNMAAAMCSHNPHVTTGSMVGCKTPFINRQLLGKPDEYSVNYSVVPISLKFVGID